MDHVGVGKIEDVLVDGGGQVRAVVIGVGGFLGIGEKSVALPFDQIAWNFSDVADKRSELDRDARDRAQRRGGRADRAGHNAGGANHPRCPRCGSEPAQRSRDRCDRLRRGRAAQRHAGHGPRRWEALARRDPPDAGATGSRAGVPRRKVPPLASTSHQEECHAKRPSHRPDLGFEPPGRAGTADQPGAPDLGDGPRAIQLRARPRPRRSTSTGSG
ncbi:PRC-barrel domain-containing protein (plasmid) [Methylobacterium oryzae CBMB20]